MAASTTDSDGLHRIVHVKSTHAPLRRRYMQGTFQNVGEAGEHARVDPDTGAEYRALGGQNHEYSTDYHVGGSYPATVFVYGARGDGSSVDHDTLERTLRTHGLWSDALNKVILPRGMEGGKPTWWNAFQYRPPERAPASVGRLATEMAEIFGEENIVEFSRSVETYLE